MDGDDFEEALSTAETLQSVLDDLETRSRSFGSALTSALKGAVIEGDSLTEVLQGLATRISSIALDSGLHPLETRLSGMISGFTGSLGQALGYARGGLPGRIEAFADGGVVSGPTYFASGGGIGLMGEAGSEAILPLRRGPDGRLGVGTGGGATAAPQIVFNVTAQDAHSFLKSEGQISAMLTRTVARGRRGL